MATETRTKLATITLTLIGKDEVGVVIKPHGNVNGKQFPRMLVDVAKYLLSAASDMGVSDAQIMAAFDGPAAAEET